MSKGRKTQTGAKTPTMPSTDQVLRQMRLKVAQGKKEFAKDIMNVRFSVAKELLGRSDIKVDEVLKMSDDITKEITKDFTKAEKDLNTIVESTVIQ